MRRVLAFKPRDLALTAAAALSCALLAPASASADVVTLTSGNSSATFNTGWTGNVYNNASLTNGQQDWIIDGVNHLKRQWFYYRVGASGPEQSIDTLFQTGIDTSSPDVLLLQYADNANPTNAKFVITLSFTLTGFPAGSYQSDLQESVNVANQSANPLAFHLFQYADFDLSGTLHDQSVNLSIGPGTSTATQTDANMAVGETVTATAPPVTTHYEAGIYPNTLSKLTDGLPTTLSDTATASGPADLTWAFQWDFVLNPGDSFDLQKDKLVSAVNAVPEPSTFAALGLGAIAALRRRKA
jgi:hypothetical protein